MSGTLYIVSTPIGNLADITYRAVETLTKVDIIACEDTRKSGVLLKHYGINIKLISYHDHNESNKSDLIIEELKSGKNIALISDAGTPLISDPGYRLVNKAVSENIEITSIPGASAVTSSISISGLPISSFVFLGFPPHKKGRKSFIEKIDSYDETVIIYESVHRIKKLLKQVSEILDNDYEIVICRELTKQFETIYRFKSSDIDENLDKIKEKGEFVILFSKIC